MAGRSDIRITCTVRSLVEQKAFCGGIGKQESVMFLARDAECAAFEVGQRVQVRSANCLVFERRLAIADAKVAATAAHHVERQARKKARTEEKPLRSRIEREGNQRPGSRPTLLGMIERSPQQFAAQAGALQARRDEQLGEKPQV